MEYLLRGSVAGGPGLDLDHERFAYAGKFVTERAGKAVAREDTIAAAASFNRDHANNQTARIRYVTVREDRRGEGVGSRLLAFAGRRLADCHARVAIAVNNPIAYRACYKAGYVYTGDTTGVAELLLVYADGKPDKTDAEYQTGLEQFRARETAWPPAQRALLATTRPERIDPPSSP